MTTSAYSFIENSGHAIVDFNESLSDAKWEEIEATGIALKEKLSQMTRPVFIVDLSKLTFMGSSIVALIVRIWKTSRERDGHMIIVNQDAVVRDVLEVAGLAKVWTIVASRDEADEMVLKPPYVLKSNMPTFFLAILGWVLAAGALGFVIVRTNKIGAVGPEIAQVLALACAGVAVLVGVVSALRDVSKSWKMLGLTLVCVAGSLVAAALMLKPLA
jgi:anti-anti-sigma factor